MNGKAICVCSSGMDSTTTAIKMREDGYDIHLLHFNYGQRAEKREEEAIRKIARYLAVPLTIWNIRELGKLSSALTDRSIELPKGFESVFGLGCLTDDYRQLVNRIGKNNCRMSQVEVGNKLLALDEETRKLTETTVTRVHIREIKSYLHIEFEDGRILNITPEHPVYASGKWYPIGELGTGNEIYSLTKAELEYMHRLKITPKMQSTLSKRYDSGEIFGNRLPYRREQSRKLLSECNPMLNLEVAKRVLRNGAKHPNKLESRFLELALRNSLPLEFVGDGSFLLRDSEGVLCPDYKVVGQRKVVEVYDPKCSRWEIRTKENYEEPRKRRLASLGYKVLFVPIDSARKLDETK